MTIAAWRSFAARWLSEAGHAVLIVKSGKDALAALDEHEVDVVLSDVRMPGMDGVDLLRSISPGNGGPDVVLMTGFASVSSAVEAIRLGAYDYLVKPFEAGQLEATLQRLAELRAAADGESGAPVPTRFGAGHWRNGRRHRRPCWPCSMRFPGSRGSANRS